MYLSEAEKQEREKILLTNLKAQIIPLEEFLKKINGHWIGEDPFYRFYHHSFKVYGIQKTTTEIVEMLSPLLPDSELNSDFLRIIKEGTGKEFKMEHNERWHEETRPILEAFFHAKTMLELAVKYGNSLTTPPQMLPSGWAALLYLYNIR